MKNGRHFAKDCFLTGQEEAFTVVLSFVWSGMRNDWPRQSFAWLTLGLVWNTIAFVLLKRFVPKRRKEEVDLCIDMRSS